MNMLRPSYTELMNVMNDNDPDNRVTSRYTVVIAAAKRARQIIDGSEPMMEYVGADKAVSAAVQEMYAGKVWIRVQDDIAEEEPATSNGPKREQFFETEI